MNRKDRRPIRQVEPSSDMRTERRERGDFELGEKRGWELLPMPTAHDEPPNLGLDPVQPVAQGTDPAQSAGQGTHASAHDEQ